MRNLMQANTYIFPHLQFMLLFHLREFYSRFLQGFLVPIKRCLAAFWTSCSRESKSLAKTNAERIAVITANWNKSTDSYPKTMLRSKDFNLRFRVSVKMKLDLSTEPI